jgi:phospholipase C
MPQPPSLFIRPLAVASFLLAALLVGCGGVGGTPGGGGGGPTPAPTSTPSPGPTATPTPSGKIKHVVVVIQENRSVDNLFHGFPGADTVSVGSWGSQQVTLQPFDLASPYSIDHTHGAFLRGFDRGKMDGFGDVDGGDFGGGKRAKAGTAAYVYVPQSDVQPYWDLASQFALSDETFESYQGPSFVSHLFMIAGQADQMAENPNGSPWGCDAPAGTTVATIDARGEHHDGMFPCVTMTTIADELDAAGISWHYYAPLIDPESSGPGDYGRNWSAFDAIKNVRYGPDWANVISPETTVLQDISGGTLPQISWVVPSLNNSDHPGDGIDNGPTWVTSITNAIQQSKYWNDCAVIVVWDDWGGWYDHVAPHIYDYQSLGFRVPLIAVSPYAKRGYVSHVQYETASVLRFIEAQFGLATLGGADARAAGLDDLFDFSQAPRKPKGVRLPHGAVRKMLQSARPGAPDD